MSSTFHTIDKSKFPIVVIGVSPRQPNLEEVDIWFDDMEELFDNSKGPIITITDNTNGMTWLDSNIRIAIGKRAEQFNQKYIDRNIANFLVINSLMARMMLKAVNVLIKNQETQIVVESIDEAMNQANEILKKF